MAQAQTVRAEDADTAGYRRADLPPNVGGRFCTTYLALRAAAEWAISLVLLITALPLLAVLAVLLKISSPGPVLYTQMRLGQHGRQFRIYKLRTMSHGCESETGPVWSIAGDPRATTIGRWLRVTHLDELPQLWNVLRGDMSLIGPRPERPEIAEHIEHALPEFRHRLLVRPGITGLAQVLRPPDADLDTVCLKLAHDLEYIRRLGPVLDARIAAATVLGLTMPGARAAKVLVGGCAPRQPVQTGHSMPLLRLTAPLGPSELPSTNTPAVLSKAA